VTLTFDFAVLESLDKRKNMPFLRINSHDIENGVNVLMAGYSEEIIPPFYFMHGLDINLMTEATRNALANRNILLIKSAMVSAQSDFVLTGTKSANLQEQSPGASLARCTFFYLDNMMQKGGSGGAVVNNKCELIGIMTDFPTVTITKN
jgi:hypothetical protein